MEYLLCSYHNATDRMVIVRCCGPGAFFLERVVFPFELLSFQCPGHSDVEILHPGLRGEECRERLPAEELQMKERRLPSWREWWPRVPQRAVGVRDNASSVSLRHP